MIRFSDIGLGMRNLESLSSVSGYKEIKPEGKMSDKDADDFWNGVFSGENEAEELGSEEIISEVYGRDEDDFSFETDLESPEIKGALEPFKNENWMLLSDVEKMNAIVTLKDVLSNELELNTSPEIEFYTASPNDCGSFLPEENKIMVNNNILDDPAEVVDTVAHEMRHAYQFQCALRGETYMDKLYAYNFDHYIEPSIDEDDVFDFIDYQDQLIEAEARAYAKIYRDEVSS